LQIQWREPFSPTRIFTLKSQSRGARGRTGQKISRLPCHDWKIRIKGPGFYCLARSSVVGWSKRSLSCFFARSFSTTSALGTVSDSVTRSLATTSSSISSRRIRERPIFSARILFFANDSTAAIVSNPGRLGKQYVLGDRATARKAQFNFGYKCSKTAALSRNCSKALLDLC
jgi:hypothetical protein